MTFQSGTKECHVFIDSKIKIEYILYRLSSIKDTDQLCAQLKHSYKLLDIMHEEKKMKIRNDHFINS